MKHLYPAASVEKLIDCLTQQIGTIIASARFFSDPVQFDQLIPCQADTNLGHVASFPAFRFIHRRQSLFSFLTPQFMTGWCFSHN